MVALQVTPWQRGGCLEDVPRLETGDGDAAHGRLDHEAANALWDRAPERLFPRGRTSYQSFPGRNRLVIGERARRTVVPPVSTAPGAALGLTLYVPWRPQKQPGRSASEHHLHLA